MFAFETFQVASRAAVSKKSIYSALARKGHFLNIKPIRLANGKLLWPADQVDAALFGRTVQPFVRPSDSRAAIHALLEAGFNAEGFIDAIDTMPIDMAETATEAIYQLALVVRLARGRVRNERPPGSRLEPMIREIRSAIEWAADDMLADSHEVRELITALDQLTNKYKNACAVGVVHA